MNPLPFCLRILSIFALAVIAATGASAQGVPTFSTLFSPDAIGSGNATELTFTINNATSGPADDLAFTGTLPAALTIAADTAAVTCDNAILSAPNGGSTITLSDGELADGSSCTVTVPVTSSTVGTHTFISGDLTSDLGNSGSSTDDLDVSATLAGFSKAFDTASLDPGSVTTLTYTVTNNAGGIFSSFFSETLPSGLEVSTPSNARHTCLLGTVTASSGGSSISANLTQNGVGSCTVSVDVRAVTPDSYTLTNELFDGSPISQGEAVASVTVNSTPDGGIGLIKAFDVTQASAGDTVTLTFTLNNGGRTDSATNIAFTDDLDAMLTGTVATGLPMSACGGALSGTSTIALSGGSLAAGAECTIDVSVQLPAGAASGTYTNTSGAVTGDIGGTPYTGGTATTILNVFGDGGLPPTISKSFTDDPTLPGDIVTIEYTLTNPNVGQTISDIAFIDNITEIDSGISVTTLPSAGDCSGSGTFSSVIDTDVFGVIMTGGTLVAGDSCTFSAVLTVATAVAPGDYLSTTDDVTATVNGGSVTTFGVSDTLTVQGGAILSLSKAFLDDQAVSGGTTDLTFSMSSAAESASTATVIAFTDDLENDFLSGTTLNSVLSNTCGGSASGTSTISYSGGSIDPGDSCEISVRLDLGAGTGTQTNTTSTLTATAGGEATVAAAASDDILLNASEPPVVSFSFNPDTAFPGATTQLDITLENPAANAANATGIIFTSNLGGSGGALSGLASSSGTLNNICGAGSQITGTTLLIFTGGDLAPGATCNFSLNVDVPAGAADGSYSLVSSSVTATVGADPVTGTAATTTLSVASDILQASKSFIDDPVLAGDTATLRFTIENIDPDDTVSNIAFTDDLDAMLSSTVATGLPATVCGGGTLSGTSTLSLTGGVLPAGAAVTFDVTVQVPGGASAGSYTNTTSTFTGDVGGLAVTGAAVSDTLQVVSVAPPSFDLSILGDPTPAEGELTYRFTITNHDSSSAISDLEFSNDLDAVLSGLVATSGTGLNICGDGSSLSGTSSLAFSGGSVDPSTSCSFDVSVQVPSSPADGTYTNTTSSLLSNGLTMANAASDTFTVDATDPTLSAIDLIAGSDTGTSDSDDETADSSPTIEFTAESGATIEIDWGNSSGFVSASDGTGAAQQETIGTAYGRDGDKTIEVRATDATGNQVSQSLTIHIDTTDPDVTLTSDTSSLVTGQTATITFDFSEDVVGFDDGDVTTTGGTLSSVTVDGSDSTIYTAVFTPTTDIVGAASITVADASYNDVAGNVGSAGASPSISIDTMAPGVTLTSDVAILGVGETATITFTFTDTPTGFEDSDITVTGGTLSAVTVDSGDPAIYTAVFTPTDGSTDTPSITVAAGSYTDSVGNAGTEGTSPDITVDTAVPSVTLSADATILSGVFQVTASFDEEMTGFRRREISVSNGRASNLASSDNIIFTFDVTPQADGEVTIDIAAGVAQDTGGNDNVAADQLRVISDSTAPSVEITGPSDAVGGLFQATVTFSEDVIGFQQGDLTIAHGVISNFVGSGETYTFDVTPEIGETVVIGLAAGVAEDAAGNSNLAAADYSVRGSSPAQEFEEHREEIRDIVKTEAYTRLNAQVLANTRMVRQARNRFILGKSQLDDPGGGLASRNNLNFDVDGSLEFVDRAFSTRGVFSQQRGNFEGSYRRILFGDFDLSRDENGTVSAYLSGKIAWEHMINDQTMLGYNIGLDLGRSDIEGSFSGSQDSIGVSIGGYFVSQLAERVYADGFISFGVGRNNLDLDNGTLALSSDYDSYTTMVGAALTGVYEMSGYELWPELAFTYGYTDIGVIGLTGTAFGLTDSSLTLDAGYVALGTLSFAPEFIIPMDGRPALESNRMLSFKPNVTCEMVKSGSSTSNCGGGVALGIYAVSRNGQALLDAKVRIDRIGDVTRTGLELSFDYAF